MTDESKYRSSKLAANAISSRVNITPSLAIKHQLQLASRFALKTGFKDNLLISSSKKLSVENCR